MLLHTHVIKATPQYVAERSRAPWTMDGRHFFNDGNLAECGVNEHFGYGFRYDKKAVAFDIGSDIEALRMSIKSDGCSLACVYRTNKETAKAEIIAEYFERVHSNRWVYVVRTEMSLEIYEMNAMEFRQFVEKFSGLSRESGKDYYKLKIRTTNKMMAWLKAQL